MLFERVGAVLEDKYKLYYTRVFIDYGLNQIFRVKFIILINKLTIFWYSQVLQKGFPL